MVPEALAKECPLESACAQQKVDSDLSPMGAHLSECSSNRHMLRRLQYNPAKGELNVEGCNESTYPTPCVATRKCIEETESNGHHDVCILKSGFQRNVSWNNLVRLYNQLSI